MRLAKSSIKSPPSDYSRRSNFRHHGKTIDTRVCLNLQQLQSLQNIIVKYCLLGKRTLLVGVKLMKIDGEMHSKNTMVDAHQMGCVSTPLRDVKISEGPTSSGVSKMKPTNPGSLPITIRPTHKISQQQKNRTLPTPSMFAFHGFFCWEA